MAGPLPRLCGGEGVWRVCKVRALLTCFDRNNTLPRILLQSGECPHWHKEKSRQPSGTSPDGIISYDHPLSGRNPNVCKIRSMGERQIGFFMDLVFGIRSFRWSRISPGKAGGFSM